MTFRQTSFNYLHVQNEHEMKSNLDRDLKTIYTSHGTLNATAIKAPVFGTSFATNSGTAFVVNGKMLGFPTGLTKVRNVVVTLNAGNGVPLNMWPTAQPSQSVQGAIDIFIFQPTSNVDNTPIPVVGSLGIHWYVTGEAVTTT